MAAPKRNEFVREIEQAFKNYADDTSVPLRGNESKAIAYERAIAQHSRAISNGDYGYDNLLLEAVYSALASSDVEEVRANAVTAAAILVAICESTKPVEAEDTPSDEQNGPSGDAAVVEGEDVQVVDEDAAEGDDQ